ncbi:hypothetical protein [Solicola gregarius]|uniref:Uncharacterized protein n=1 Tax=Solicola gregarius TaxID=2908642 RepID=A0AA46YKW6_9ACTN|nr:hypothetical protein [Solicola gregarius]UYM04931.1 hypothetical protein L0C25_20785 [Solicola gregarius]
MISDPTYDAYRRRAEDVLADIQFGPRRLFTATDAEILALDGPDAKRVTPLLSLGPDVPDDQRSAAVEEAARRMFSDNAIADGTPLGGDSVSAPEPTVRTVLRMRRSWLALLAIDQRTAFGRQWVTAYLRADRRVLAEAVTPEGEHLFSAMKRALALDSAVQSLAPIPEATDEDGPGRRLDARTWQYDVRESLAEAKIVSVVIARRHDGSMRNLTDDRFSVYNFADRTEIMYAEDPDHVRIAPVSRQTLRDRLEAITSPLDGYRPADA